MDTPLSGRERKRHVKGVLSGGNRANVRALRHRGIRSCTEIFVTRMNPAALFFRTFLLSADFNIRHNADLVLQFVFCLAMKSGFLPEEPYQPMRQRQGVLWNQNARIALEYATTICFFPKLKEVNSFADYQKFCSENSQHWVLKAIQFQFQCV